MCMSGMRVQSAGRLGKLDDDSTAADHCLAFLNAGEDLGTESVAGTDADLYFLEIFRIYLPVDEVTAHLFNDGAAVDGERVCLAAGLFAISKLTGSRGLSTEVDFPTLTRRPESSSRVQMRGSSKNVKLALSMFLSALCHFGCTLASTSNLLSLHTFSSNF